MIVLDTSVLSHVFRRTPESGAPVVARFKEMVAEGLDLSIPGIVLQELLSGLKRQTDFNRLRAALDGFPLICSDEADHVEAARLLNALRSRGIAASTVDALIAAMSIRRQALLFTVDEDFRQFSAVSSLRLVDDL